MQNFTDEEIRDAIGESNMTNGQSQFMELVTHPWSWWEHLLNIFLYLILLPAVAIGGYLIWQAFATGYCDWYARLVGHQCVWP